MKTVTQDWDRWGYLFRVTHREQIHGIAQWDECFIPQSPNPGRCDLAKTLRLLVMCHSERA